MKPHQSVSITAAAVALLFLAGCATTGPKVQTEFDPAAEFTTATTFNVAPMPKSIPGVDPGLILRVGPAAVAAAKAAMLEKGFTEVADVTKADIAVRVHGKAVPKTDITDWGFSPYYGGAGWYGGYPYGAYGGSSVTVDQYNEGTLIVEVYDVKTTKMIWVGWITARTTTKQEEQATRVAAGVTEILLNYPAAGMKPVAPPPEK